MVIVDFVWGSGLAALLGALSLVAALLHPKLRLPSADVAARSTGAIARLALRGALVGGACGLACLAAGIASKGAAQWVELLTGERIAVACALILLACQPAGDRLRLWVVAGVATCTSLVAIPLHEAVAAPVVVAPLGLALLAAVAGALAASPSRLSRLAARAREISIRATGDGILVVDSQGQLLHACDSARAALDLSAATGASVPKIIHRVLEKSAGAERVTWKSPQGRYFEAWVSELGGRGASKGVRGVLIRDATTRRINQTKLVRLAHYDSLTGLANRRLFLESLAQRLESARKEGDRVALFYIDLDHFKAINDSLGHGAGDTMLQGLAERFRQKLDGTSLDARGLGRDLRIDLARLAGDEFAVVASGLTDSKTATEIAEYLLELISAPTLLGDNTVSGSGSVGVAISPDDATDIDALIRHADSALYVAKSRGRNRFARFDPSFETKADRARLIAAGLGRAIERNELRLHYQPKVDLISGTAHGLEALLRWKSPDLGDVGPTEFIPVAESRGLITGLGSWVVEETCRQLRAWRDAGFEVVPVAVNVSSLQFSESDLQRVVSDALRRHRVEPQLLELELTESLLLEGGDATELCLRDLHAIGIRIALDDFGTGYSALTYLNRFDLDVLKIDRALLLDIHTNSSAAGIASAVVSMAHSLGLTVVAEGIDTEAQLEPLRQMRCDQVQGFLYSSALPADAAEQFLATAGQHAPVVRPSAVPPGMRSAVNAREQLHEDDAELPAIRGASDPTVARSTQARPSQRMLLVDDGRSTLGHVALRLGRIGVDLHYASEPDEGHLFIRQEGDRIRLLAVSPGVESEAIEQMLQSLDRAIGTRPPLVVIGAEPDDETRFRLKQAGANWVLWEPFSDAELRHLVKSAMAPSNEISQRLMPRVPVDLIANVRVGQRRETCVISSLSARGAFIEISNPPTVATTLQIEFDLDLGHFRGFGRVVHEARETDGDSSMSVEGVGIVFFGIDREMTRLLLEAVQLRESRYLP